MSLINDALKRASTQKPTPAPPPGGPPLQPAETADRSNPLPIILCIVGIGALLMAGAFWLKSRGTPQTTVAEKPSSVSSPVESKPVPAQNPIERTTATLQKVMERNSDQTAPVTRVTNTSAPTVASATAPAATAPTPTPAQPAPPPTPTFHLQAIYYRMKGPTVVINGKTLKVGDHLDGATLIGIERTSAEIEFEGKSQRLTVQ